MTPKRCYINLIITILLLIAFIAAYSLIPTNPYLLWIGGISSWFGLSHAIIAIEELPKDPN